jgi:hypothetical protein
MAALSRTVPQRDSNACEGWIFPANQNQAQLLPPAPLSINMPFTAGEDVSLQLDSKIFDFNLQFEQLYFSIVPSALFIVASSWRTLSQARKPKMVHSPTFQNIKLVCIALSS